MHGPREAAPPRRPALGLPRSAVTRDTWGAGSGPRAGPPQGRPARGGAQERAGAAARLGAEQPARLPHAPPELARAALPCMSGGVCPCAAAYLARATAALPSTSILRASSYCSPFSMSAPLPPSASIH
ncbi:hypothetical protein PVAP13_1KG472905 [Panicum virgatum]|uniref:Uncharacterized protein n=1 Tax=Panicum virgatum TaxID=38727 RepID=A0A8T0XPR1_PANVG|nr:hypothetical protein PVAP13_1KG472905 [Panicum virgatum]